MSTTEQTQREHNQSIDEDVESPLARLSEEEIEALGREFDAIHDEVFSDLGERDATYIKSMIEMHRRLVVMGRVELLASRFWPAWLLGTASLSAAKILENMEIGHNVMHGQWDWMNNPEIHSSTWDWDTASTKEAWKHSHNYVHHTYTNIRGKDKDLGYEIMRIDPHQKWHPVYLLQPFYNVLLMALFEWGVAFHDLDFEAIRKGEKSKKQVAQELKGIAGKARAQIVKDYIAFPALSGLIAGGVAAAGGDAIGHRREGRRARLADRLCAPAPSRRPLDVAMDGVHGRVQALLPLDDVGGRDREHGPQLLVERDHLLRPLPRPDLHLQPRRRSRTRARAAGTSASCAAPPTSRAAASSTSPRATSATRSSTTCSRTCPRPATARSRRRCATSASATGCPTTPARSASSGARSSARSCGSRSPAASRGRSPVPTGATTSMPRR